MARVRATLPYRQYHALETETGYNIISLPFPEDYDRQRHLGAFLVRPLT